MTSLILGLILWIAAHTFKRIFPAARARMGNAGRGVIGALLLLALYLIVSGYRSAEVINIWTPPAWTMHLTDLLMLFAVALFGAGHSKSRLRARVRHPMLAGLRTWAVAHLLVNGDLAAIVLFATLFLWATLQAALINRAEPSPPAQPSGSLAGDIRLAVISVVLYAAIAAVHFWLGYPVFPG